MSETIQHQRDASAVYEVELVRKDGTDLEYDGTEVLTVQFWPGDTRDPIAGLTAAWETPPDLVSVTVPQSVTEDLDPGVYKVHVMVGPTNAWVWAAEFFLDILPGPGTDDAPAVYATYDELLKVAPWVRTLAEDDQQAGFLEQRAQARQWLDKVILAKRTSATPYYSGSEIFQTGVGGSHFVDSTMQDALLADGLLTTSVNGLRLREAVSHKAAAIVASRQFALTRESGYAERKMEHEFEASGIVACAIAEVDTDDDDDIDVRVNLGSFRIH